MLIGYNTAPDRGRNNRKRQTYSDGETNGSLTWPLSTKAFTDGDVVSHNTDL